MQRSPAARHLTIFLRASLVTTAGNACAYLFQLLLARAVSPGEFGAVNVLLSLAMLITAPIAAAPAAISRLLINHGGSPELFAALVQRIMVAGICIGGCVVALYLPFAGFVEQTLHVGWLAAWVLTPILLASILLYHVPLGLWQGQRSYNRLAVGAAGVPLIRFLTFAGVVIVFGGGIHSALLALAAGGVVVFAIGVWSFRSALILAKPGQFPDALRETLQFSIPAVLMSVALLGLTYIDQPLVRAFNSPESSGLYAAASTLSKIALLLPAALINIVFPEAASLARNQAAPTEESFRLIMLALGVTGGISASAALVMTIEPELCLRLLAGQPYVAAAPILQILAPGMAMLACVSLVVTYALARANYLLIVPLALSTPLIFAVCQFVRPDTRQMAWILFSAIAILLCFSITWLRLTHRRREAPIGKAMRQ
ncbi:oligosaccharide flippase family protein [Terrarubrum flagellatum]|uniref:oligosaccharide flippase family protein n=1 Tax=Terrirubrum flagellatum TaxID=2895980 RepID=UPI0031451EA3